MIIQEDDEATQMMVLVGGETGSASKGLERNTLQMYCRGSCVCVCVAAPVSIVTKRKGDSRTCMRVRSLCV